ncbi:MAG: DUF354 domain-containing protein [Helicobacter sp.]|nr:DUF354 domain-containing protein [Helicobacter sp.]
MKIWLDITDPKYALFLSPLISELKKSNELLITSRQDSAYSELASIFELLGIDAFYIGKHGGANILDKFKARLYRQNEFLNIFKKTFLPDLLITGASVEAAQCAFGCGIKIIHFADTPLAGNSLDKSLYTKVARLSLGLSDIIFHPFVVPKEAFLNLGLKESQVICQDFIDVALWLWDLGEDIFNNKIDHQKRAEFCKKLGLDPDGPIILAREEEFKAHYVGKKYSLFYDALKELKDYQIILMPRYEIAPLLEEFNSFKNIRILSEKLLPREFYPFVDLLIGGGGTMNLEAAFLGIPVISVRSLLLFHDVHLMQNNLMHHAKTTNDVVHLASILLKNARSARSDNRAIFFKNRQIYKPNFDFASEAILSQKR